MYSSGVVHRLHCRAVHLRLPGFRRIPGIRSSDREGNFTFSLVQPNKYELVVQAPVIRAVIQSVDASSGKDIAVPVLYRNSFPVRSFHSRELSRFFGARSIAFFTRTEVQIVKSSIVANSTIENASVYVIDPCFGIGVKTRRDGTFLMKVPQGYYQLRVQGSGFLPIDQIMKAIDLYVNLLTHTYCSAKAKIPRRTKLQGSESRRRRLYQQSM